MSNSLIISKKDRLPTLEVMGTEYPFDISDSDTLARLKELAETVEGTGDGVVDACKRFVTTFFCDNEEVVQKIEPEYKKSVALWVDVVGQLAPFCQDMKIKSVIERTNALKKASDNR
jgi:hypothetical protein